MKLNITRKKNGLIKNKLVKGVRNMSEKKELVFNVANMKCGGCVSAVESAIKALNDTDVVEVSLDAKRAVVNSDLNADEIAKAITDAGYPAELAG